MKQLFLPFGLVISFIVAWWLPQPGTYLKQAGLVPWMVVLIFLINGYQTQLRQLPKGKGFLQMLLLAALICLVVSPLLGSAVAGLMGLSAGLTLGLLVKSAVPSTLSTCIVMTGLAGGNSLSALVMTVALNLLGILSIPIMLSLTLQTTGELEIDPIALLWQLVLLVLLPLLVGFFIKRLSNFPPNHISLQYLPSSCVILTVWMALSDSHEVFQTLTLISLLQVLVAALMVHYGLMLISLVVASRLAVKNEEKIALIFTASQKTLPVAVSVLAALNYPLGEALLLCVLFHFIMLFGDALLVKPISKQFPTER